MGTDIVDGGDGKDTLELNLSAIANDLTITNPLSGGSLPGISSLENIEVIHLLAGSGDDSITQAGIIDGVANGVLYLTASLVIYSTIPMMPQQVWVRVGILLIYQV